MRELTHPLCEVGGWEGGAFHRINPLKPLSGCGNLALQRVQSRAQLPRAFETPHRGCK